MTAYDERPLLVTSALPYANGPLHFGHVAGAYLPADLFVRYQRLRARDVLYICGTDEHGVSITVNAEKAGRPYQAYVDGWYAVIRDLFERFQIAFDHFGRTSRDTPEHPHRRLSQEFFLRLRRAGVVEERTTRQHFCLTDQRFLPDRYVEGTCYICGKRAARGDECKACGSWLEAVKIVEPVCVTCGHTPEVRDTTQYELDLSPFGDDQALAARLPHAFPAFANWRVKALKANAKRNVETAVFEKLLVEDGGLRSRPITRDLPWGVPLPARDLDGQPVVGADAGKVLYVWFDAPIGYVSATVEWAHRWTARTGNDGAAAQAAWRRFWIDTCAHDYGASSGGEHGRWPGPRLVHFIGKDNIPFHCVVFPAMLGWQAPVGEGDARHAPGGAFLGPGQGERWVLPEAVPANEFYNLEGRKFSTSDNWMLDISRMFELFGVDPLRWYLTVSMPETADSQFLFSELKAQVNAGLADTLGNYASRVLKFVDKHFGRRVPEPDEGLEHALPGLDGGGEATLRPVATAAWTRRLCAGFFRPAGSTGTEQRPSLAERFERHEFRRASEELLALARLGNAAFDAQQPWKTRKLDDQADCRTALWCHCQVLSALAVAMWPFMPGSSDALRTMLGLPTLSELDGARADRRHLLGEEDDLWRWPELPAGHALGEPGILFRKVDDETVEAERARLATPA